MWSSKAYRILAILLVSGITPTLGAQASETNGRVILSVGDAIKITVWRRPELSGEFLISADSTIVHPLYRDVHVAGVPQAVFEQRIRSFLSELEANPQFVLQPLLRVSIGGEVRQPNLFRLPPETTIAEAVALAGGVSERARMDKVRLLRENEEIVIDLTSPEFGMAQTPILSGDQIFVQRKTNFFKENIAPMGGIFAALISLVSILTR